MEKRSVQVASSATTIKLAVEEPKFVTFNRFAVQVVEPQPIFVHVIGNSREWPLMDYPICGLCPNVGSSPEVAFRLMGIAFEAIFSSKVDENALKRFFEEFRIHSSSKNLLFRVSHDRVVWCRDASELPKFVEELALRPRCVVAAFLLLLLFVDNWERVFLSGVGVGPISSAAASAHRKRPFEICIQHNHQEDTVVPTTLDRMALPIFGEVALVHAYRALADTIISVASDPNMTNAALRAHAMNRNMNAIWLFLLRQLCVSVCKGGVNKRLFAYANQFMGLVGVMSGGMVCADASMQTTMVKLKWGESKMLEVPVPVLESKTGFVHGLIDTLTRGTDKFEKQFGDAVMTISDIFPDASRLVAPAEHSLFVGLLSAHDPNKHQVFMFQPKPNELSLCSVESFSERRASLPGDRMQSAPAVADLLKTLGDRFERKVEMVLVDIPKWQVVLAMKGRTGSFTRSIKTEVTTTQDSVAAAATVTPQSASPPITPSRVNAKKKRDEGGRQKAASSAAKKGKPNQAGGVGVVVVAASAGSLTPALDEASGPPALSPKPRAAASGAVESDETLAANNTSGESVFDCF